MIRKVLIAALAVAFAQSAGAQSLQDLIRNALESLSGKTSEESAAPAAVAEPLAATELPGVWNYRAPALEYTGDDMLARWRRRRSADSCQRIMRRRDCSWTRRP